MRFYILEFTASDLLEVSRSFGTHSSQTLLDEKSSRALQRDIGIGRQNFFGDENSYTSWQQALQKPDSRNYSQGDLTASTAISSMFRIVLDHITDGEILNIMGSLIDSFSFFNDDKEAAGMAFVSATNLIQIIKTLYPETPQDILKKIPSALAMLTYPSTAKSFADGQYTLVIRSDESLFQYIAPKLLSTYKIKVDPENIGNVIKEKLRCASLSKIIDNKEEFQSGYYVSQVSTIYDRKPWEHFFSFISGREDYSSHADPKDSKTDSKQESPFSFKPVESCELQQPSEEIRAFFPADGIDENLLNLFCTSVDFIPSEAALAPNIAAQNLAIHHYIIKTILDHLATARDANNQVWTACLEELLDAWLKKIPENNSVDSLKAAYDKAKIELEQKIEELNNTNPALAERAKAVITACDKVVSKQEKIKDEEKASVYCELATTLELTTVALNDKDPIKAGKRMCVYGEKIHGHTVLWKKILGGVCLFFGVALMVVGTLFALATIKTGIGFFAGLGIASGGFALTSAGIGLWQHGRQKGAARAVAETGKQLKNIECQENPRASVLDPPQM